MINLTGKNVLITGGSRGIGAACVKLFIKANSNVAFTYNKNEAAAKELIDSLSTINKLKSYRLDLLESGKIEDSLSEIMNDFGKFDILVNNAGIWKFGKSDEMSFDEWKETIDINLNATFLITKAVIPGMKRKKFGRIINITSTAGQRGEANHSHYAASKGGVISFTKSLAAELGEFNITVNSVAPGWVDTDMTSDTLADNSYRKKIENEIPLKKIASGNDIAGPVLFLASELGNHVNGEILNVNGGSVLCG